MDMATHIIPNGTFVFFSPRRGEEFLRLEHSHQQVFGGIVNERPDTISNCRSTVASVKPVPLVSTYKKPYFAAASIIDRPTSGVGSEISKMGSWRAATAVAPFVVISNLILQEYLVGWK